MSVNLFGTDMGGAFEEIGNRVKDMFAGVSQGGRDVLGEAQARARDVFGEIGGGGRDPFAGVRYDGGGGIGGYKPEVKDPFAGVRYGLDSPLLALPGSKTGIDNAFYRDEFSAFDQAKARRDAHKAEEETRAAIAKATAQSSGAQSGGMNFAGPATADDNAALSGQAINDYIARTKPGSPLIGMGDFILGEANRQGVSVPLLVGIMTLESQLGSDGSYLPSVYNYGGLTGTGWQGQTGNTTGMARAFATFATKEDGIRALIANLATSQYKGKSVQQQIGTWYLGNPNASPTATDEQGNATMADYLATIAQAYGGLGVTYNQSQGGTPKASQPGYPSGGPVFQTLFGGATPKIMQEYGVTPTSEGYRQAGNTVYNYGSSYGMAGGGHPGVDYGLDYGTKLYVPVSGTVSVVGNDHGTGYYFTNTMGPGDRDHSGELAITLANGDIVILGHMSQIALQAGQQVNAGAFAGLSGGSEGAHLHLEVRQKQPDGSYRLVDPRAYFGGR